MHTSILVGIVLNIRGFHPALQINLEISLKSNESPHFFPHVCTLSITENPKRAIRPCCVVVGLSTYLVQTSRWFKNILGNIDQGTPKNSELYCVD